MTSETAKAFTTAAALVLTMAAGSDLTKGLVELSSQNQQDLRHFNRQQTMKPAVPRLKPGAGYWQEE